MSDIQAGDLVMVVRGHSCLIDKYIGAVFVAGNIIIHPPGRGFTCPQCGLRSAGGDEPGTYAVFGRAPGYIPLSWLRKINPPAVQQTTDEEITA